MMHRTHTLRELLIYDLPPAFVRSLLERIEKIYPDSHSMVLNDPALGEEQANYTLGYYRRGLVETALMRIAAEHGLKVEMQQPETGGCKCVYVAAGRFGFTMCHVLTSGGFPKQSDTREQSSKINEHISQGNLFPIDSNPRNEEFYGIFVHTEQPGKKDTFKSLHVGFPTHEFDGWIEEPIDLLDIADIQQRLFQKQDDLHAQIQTPKPAWKQKEDVQSGGGDNE